MKKKACLFFLSLFTLMGNLYSQTPNTKIYLNIQDLQGASIKNVFSNVSYFVPKNVVLKSIKDLKPFDGGYLVVEDKQFYCFNKNGEVRFKINQIPSVTLNYTKGDGFEKIWIDTGKKELVLGLEKNEKNKAAFIGAFFDYNGKFLRSVTLNYPFVVDYIGNDVFAVKEDYKNDGYKLSLDHHITFISTENKILKAYLPIETDIFLEGLDNTLTGSCGKISNSNDLLFSNKGSFSVYQVGINGVNMQYDFILPKNRILPGDYLHDKTLKGKVYELALKNPQSFYGIYSISKINNWIFPSFVGEKGGEFIMYNTTSGNAFSFSKIQEDESNYFLPISSFPKVFALDQKSIITVVNPDKVKIYSERNSNKNILYPENLKHYFSTPFDSRNPLIVRLETK